MKQSAVEWLVEQIKEDSNLRLRGFDIDGIGKQAKEMEKQQQGYSEEEVYHILCEHTAELFKGSKMTLTEWFEQYKKK